MSRHLHKYLLLIVLIILPLCGVWQIGQSAWIHAKAGLAQILLETAWSETLRTGKEVKPWPWADTWPVARLSVPHLGIRRIVLAGASGSSLAFGPGHFFTSAKPGSHGNIVIAGHRDTHFRFLQNLEPGDVILLESTGNKTTHFRITAVQVLHRDDTSPLHDSQQPLLTLITCYPFAALVPGGPLRYVVTADARAAGKKML